MIYFSYTFHLILIIFCEYRNIVNFLMVCNVTLDMIENLSFIYHSNPPFVFQVIGSSDSILLMLFTSL